MSTSFLCAYCMNGPQVSLNSIGIWNILSVLQLSESRVCTLSLMKNAWVFRNGHDAIWIVMEYVLQLSWWTCCHCNPSICNRMFGTRFVLCCWGRFPLVGAYMNQKKMSYLLCTWSSCRCFHRLPYDPQRMNFKRWSAYVQVLYCKRALNTVHLWCSRHLWYFPPVPFDPSEMLYDTVVQLQVRNPI